MLEVLLQDLACARIPRESQFHDLVMLVGNRLAHVGVDHEQPAVALQLIVKNLAEIQQPGRSAAALQSPMEGAVPLLPFVAIGARLLLGVLLDLAQLVVGRDDGILPFIAAKPN
jgi:hypothetical protein